MNTIRCKNIGNGSSQGLRVIPAVMGNGYADILTAVFILQEIAESLRGFPESILVNPVRPYAHNTPDAPGAEFQVPVKGVGDGFKLIVVKHLPYFRFGLAVVTSFEPAGYFFFYGGIQRF